MAKWWIQADCVLIEALNVDQAINKYRVLVHDAEMDCSVNQHCAALRALALTNRNAYEYKLAKAVEPTDAPVS